MIRDAPHPHISHSTLKTTFVGLQHPISTSELPVHQFRGIKYASVPARFRQSMLFTAFPPATDATRFGAICPQPQTIAAEERLTSAPHEHDKQQTLHQNEFECLNLSITCPGRRPTGMLYPVMLWIHGGGDSGSGSSLVYDGGPLVQKSMQMGKPVIMVAINFRVGLFGFAASPMLLEDNMLSGDVGVGNYGLRDQRRAMEWVNRYISEFGGNPSNVTIFGEATGAADVLCHMLSSANQIRPLFHRAIVQSSIFDHVQDVRTAGSYLSRVMLALRISTLDQLRAIDAESIAPVGYPLRATDDGIFFSPGWKDSITPHREANHRPRLLDSHLNAHTHVRPKLPRRSSKSPSRASAVAAARRYPQPAHLQPLIIGDCSNESIIWSGPASRWSTGALTRRLKAVCQSLSGASALLRAYHIHDSSDGDVVDRVLELINDARVAWPTECIAEGARRERGGRNVWRYVFDQEGPARGVSHHAADLIYLFDNTPFSAFTPASPSPNGFWNHDPLELMQREQELKLKLETDGLFHDVDGFPDVDLAAPAHSFSDDEWSVPIVDEWNYTRIRDAVQEKWISFAYGEAPWAEDKVYVFGPGGEIGERPRGALEDRRRKDVWVETLEPLGMPLVQKVGMELSNGPPMTY